MDVHQQLSEDELSYIERIIQYKEQNAWTWQDIATILNTNLQKSYGESYYRKHYGYLVKPHVEPVEEQIEFNDDIECDELLRIQKEKIKLSDILTQNNAIIRRMSREETIKEIAKEACDAISEKICLDEYKSNYIEDDSCTAGILQLSDWHYGININSYWNMYNPTIAKQRINTLYEKVCKKLDKNNVKNLVVVNTGDLIAGNIHMPIRLNSRKDVITQIMEVSELLSEFIAKLSLKYNIDYYDCSDNHSRIDPNKNNSLDLESLTRITHWYLKQRLQDFNVVVHDNEFSNDIITFDVFGYNIAAVHGDDDKQEKVIDNVTLMTKRTYDLVLTSHMHHFAGNEHNETIMLSNPSLMGTDAFAEKLRVSARPAQNLIIVSEDSVVDTIYRILVD